MKTMIATLLACGLALPAAAGTWTATGSNGGTGAGSWDCSRGGGSAACTSQGSWTGPNGQTATRTRSRLTTGGQTTVNGTTTGPNGQSRSWTRTWRR